jgi:hypothetical protein
MKHQTEINVDKILRIKFTPRCQSTRYNWTEAKPEKKFLWWVSEKAKPAGWDDRCGNILTEEYILKYEERILFKRYDVLNEFSLWEKARVEIESMGGRYTNSDYVYFETDEEALVYVRGLADRFKSIQIEY